MKLTLQDVTQKKNEFEKAGITLPSYDIEAVHKKTLEEPVWVHFGAGNIFRGYIAGPVSYTHLTLPTTSRV